MLVAQEPLMLIHSIDCILEKDQSNFEEGLLVAVRLIIRDA